MEYNYKGKKPTIHKTCFIGDGAKIIGDVILKENASLWFNGVIRGDITQVIVGENSNIQDGAIVHCDHNQPTIIGNNVTIGHGAIIHGCSIEENCLIGMGAIIMSGALIGKNSLVAAGTMIPPGKIIPKNSLVMGNPGQVMREITKKDLEGMMENTKNYVDLAKEYKKAYQLNPIN